MRARLIATVAVAAAVVLGTTGCSMLAPQSTTVQYSASDGMNVPDSSGPLQVRNALFVANEDGSEGNFVAAIVNGTDSSEVLHIQIGDGDGAIVKSVRVEAHTTKGLGVEDIEGVENFEGADPLLVVGLDTPPGATVSVYFQSGDGDGARVDIPVLDSSIAYLATLAP